MINCIVCRKPIEKGLYIDPKTRTSMHRECAKRYDSESPKGKTWLSRAVRKDKPNPGK